MQHFKGSHKMLQSPFENIDEEPNEDGSFAEADLESQQSITAQQHAHFASGAASLDEDDDINITEGDQNVSPLPVAVQDGRSFTTPHPTQQEHDPARSPMASISPNVLPTSTSKLRHRRRKQSASAPKSAAMQGQQLTDSGRGHEAQGHHSGQSIGGEVTPRIQNTKLIQNQHESTPSVFSKVWSTPPTFFSPQIKMVGSAYNSVLKLATQGHGEPNNYTPAEAAAPGPGPEPEVYNAPTELHKCCHEAEHMGYLSDFVKNCKDGTLGSTTELDDKGRLPLHVISENMTLFSSNFDCGTSDFVYAGVSHPRRQASVSHAASSSRGQGPHGRKSNSLNGPFHNQFGRGAGRRRDVGHISSNHHPSVTNSAPAIKLDERHLKSFAWDFIKQLVLHHPMALSTEDHEEYIPFVRSINRWVIFVYKTEDISSSRHTNSRRTPSAANASGIGTEDGNTVSLMQEFDGEADDCVMQQEPNNTEIGSGESNAAPSRIRTPLQHNGATHAYHQSRPRPPLSTPGRRATTPNQNPIASSLFSATNSTNGAEFICGSTTAAPIRTPSETNTNMASTEVVRFPEGVRMSPQVEWCLHMLSAIIEHLEEQSESLVNAEEVTICQGIVQAVASIPLFIQTLLLIEDERKRECIFGLTVVRRVMLNKYSIGKWLTSMLSSKKSVAKRSVAYLKLLSDVAAGEDAMDASWAGPPERDSESIAKRKSEVYQAVGEVDNLIPSMLAMDERMLEQAATTNIVKQFLDDMISRPFAVSVIFFDMLFLAFLLLSFRIAVHGYLIRLNVLTWVYLANFCIFYFVIREIGKWVSLSRTTMVAFPTISDLKQLLHVRTFWNIVDFASIVMTCLSVILLRIHVASSNGYPVDDINSWKRILFTISTGLLWLRVLGLAKTISMPLATFVLAIIQVRRLEFHFMLLLIFFHFAHVMSCLFSLTLY
jgi:hypothetical protein